MAETLHIDESVLQRLQVRPQDSHKGTFGTLNALCGSKMMPGAAYLSAMGALRSGVGLLRMAVTPEVSPILQAKLAEPVWMEPSDLLHTDASAFLCGCGLGRTQDALLETLLPQIKVPSVYDADGINFLSLHTDVLNRLQKPAILTPHPAEFSRLSGIPVTEILQKKAEIASDFAKAHGHVLVLKGHQTVIASPDGTVGVHIGGCSALAKGGSGDVLAGVIASLLAQGHSCFDSACIGVFAHAKASVLLAEKYGERGVLPSDLPPVIGKILG